jgi:hypothetical protein
VKTIAIIAFLALAACAGTPETRATNALAIACDSYATTLDQINPLIAQRKLSTANVERVVAANKLTNPVCKTDSVVDPEGAIGIVNQGIGLLTAVKNSL